MTPEEKWKRLTNPKTVEDYGLSLTEAELETFADGREVLAGMRQYTAELDDQCRIVAKLGRAAGEYVEQVRYGVLTATALPPNMEVERRQREATEETKDGILPSARTDC